MKLSIVIPAYNEEKYLLDTLEAVRNALTEIRDAEVIVVDNESTDATRRIAKEYGATVVDESVHNIAKVRNTGVFFRNAGLGRDAESREAETRSGAGEDEVIIFLDADTIVYPGVFENIVVAMEDKRCIGGSVAVDFQPVERYWVHLFLKFAYMVGRWTKMRGGACQFCRRDVFEELGGYDTTIYVGEDIDFHWRLDRIAEARGNYTTLVETPRVSTSSRRWNQMGAVRLLFVTHPITVLLGWRIRSLWKDWYERPIR